MKELLLFLYGYYEYYFILMSGIIASLIVLCIQKSKLVTIKEKCFFYTSTLLVNFSIAILFKHKFWSSRIGMKEHITAFLLENLLVFFSMLILTYFIFIILNFFNYILSRLSLLAFLKHNQWGILLFIYLSISFFLQLPSKINSYCALWYATDYSMGIGSRFFIGSILSLLNKGYTYANTAFTFCSITIVLIILLGSLLANNLIRHSDLQFRRGLIFMLVLFISSPGSIATLWQRENFGRLETYGLLISLISILLFEKISNIYIKYITVTLLTCVSMAIYQGNVFMYYPIVLFLFAYDNLFPINHVIAKRVLSIFNIIMTCSTFLYFQFFSYTKYNNLSEMIKHLNMKTNLHISDTAIDLELFQPISVAYNTLNKSFLTGDEFPREKSFFTLLLLLPLFVIILAILLKCRDYRKSKSIFILNAPYIYYLLLTFCIIPQFVLNVDWGRWMTSTTIFIFIGIFYLAYKKDPGILLALGKLTTFVSSHMFLCLILLIFTASLGKFNGREFINGVNTLAEWLVNHNFIKY